MSTTLTDAPDHSALRPLLHAELDRLRDEQLSLAHRVLMEIELHQLTGEMDDAADEARTRGSLTDQSIAKSVAEVRAARPYHQ